jgi:HSP20 family protein
MDAFRQFSRNLNQVWDELTEGGRELMARGSAALARFTPRREDMSLGFPIWGLIAAEVTEKDDALVVKIELPGMEKTDVTVRIDDRKLFVRGEKRVDRDDVGDRYHVTERAYGSFERTIHLPASVDEGSVKAAMRNGILRLDMKKAGAASGRQVDIE